MVSLFIDLLLDALSELRPLPPSFPSALEEKGVLRLGVKCLLIPLICLMPWSMFLSR